MRSLMSLIVFALVASLILAPAAMAQDDQYAMQAQDTPQQDVAEELFEEVQETPTEPLEEQLQEAQQEAALEQKTGVPEPAEVEDQQKLPPEGKQKMPPAEKKQMPKTGGIELSSLLLPASVLLVGSGVLVFAALRRR